jgi:hypothetical protein
MGDGGGFGSSRGEVASSPSSCEGDVGPETGESGEFVLEIAERPPFPERKDPASDLSTSASPLLNPDVELRGLSVLPPPGILDLSPRNDRMDSLVSALLNDG